MLARRTYSTDLSDEEWQILEHLVPRAKPGGRPRVHRTRELLDAIFYVVRGGSAPGACYLTTSLQQANGLPLLPLVAPGWELGKGAHRPQRNAPAQSRSR